MSRVPWNVANKKKTVYQQTSWIHATKAVKLWKKAVEKFGPDLGTTIDVKKMKGGWEQITAENLPNGAKFEWLPTSKGVHFTFTWPHGNVYTKILTMVYPSGETIMEMVHNNTFNNSLKSLNTKKFNVKEYLNNKSVLANIKLQEEAKKAESKSESLKLSSHYQKILNTKQENEWITLNYKNPKNNTYGYVGPSVVVAKKLWEKFKEKFGNELGGDKMGDTNNQPMVEFASEILKQAVHLMWKYPAEDCQHWPIKNVPIIQFTYKLDKDLYQHIRIDKHGNYEVFRTTGPLLKVGDEYQNYKKGKLSHVIPNQLQAPKPLHDAEAKNTHKWPPKSTKENELVVTHGHADADALDAQLTVFACNKANYDFYDMPYALMHAGYTKVAKNVLGKEAQFHYKWVDSSAPTPDLQGVLVFTKPEPAGWKTVFKCTLSKNNDKLIHDPQWVFQRWHGDVVKVSDKLVLGSATKYEKEQEAKLECTAGTCDINKPDPKLDWLLNEPKKVSQEACDAAGKPSPQDLKTQLEKLMSQIVSDNPGGTGCNLFLKPIETWAKKVFNNDKVQIWDIWGQWSVNKPSHEKEWVVVLRWYGNASAGYKYMSFRPNKVCIYNIDALGKQTYKEEFIVS